jgi:protein-tyrosine kinase
MSRIDEAMQRARARGEAVHRPPTPATDVPPELAVFASEAALDPAAPPVTAPAGEAPTFAALDALVSETEGWRDAATPAGLDAFVSEAAAPRQAAHTPAAVEPVHVPDPPPAPHVEVRPADPVQAEPHAPDFESPFAAAMAQPVDFAQQEWLEKLVTHPQVNPATIDQYRKLAATLHHAQLERATRVVMVSSAVAAEGKTLTATNLALTLCESYDRRVLLIDADLRRPTLHALVRQPLAPGLTDVVAGTTGKALPIVAVTPRFSVLTAGSPRHDPIGTLSSDKMQRLLVEASTAFDWVIIDSSPVGMLPDAHLLSTIVDSIVLVVRAGAAPYPVVQRAAESLGPDRIIGVVLNRVAAQEFTSHYPDQSYYGYYYSQYSQRPQ